MLEKLKKMISYSMFMELTENMDVMRIDMNGRNMDSISDVQGNASQKHQTCGNIVSLVSPKMM